MSEQYAAETAQPAGSLYRRLVESRDRTKRREEAQETVLELTSAIREAWCDWQNAMINFENAESKEMVDYYTYCIKASQIRYEYLLRKVKQVQVP